MNQRLAAFVLVTMCSSGALVGAQSLADVARAEEARRKSVPKAGKVYTNEDLKPELERPAPPPRPSTEATPGVPSAIIPLPPDPAPTDKPDAQKPAQDEAAWRARITAARDQLQRSQIFAEALQSRINALTTDFVNRDDPAQRALIDQDRQRALAELERVRAEILKQTRAIADIEEEARKAGVPPGWLR